MQISDLSANPRLVIEQVRSNALQELMPGKTVTAQVISSGREQNAVIEIGKTRLQVKSEIPLHRGDRLTVQVMKGGRNPELQLVREPAMAELQAKHLKSLLPNSNRVSELVNTMRQIVRGEGRPAQQHTPPLQPEAALTSTLKPPRGSLSPQSLQQLSARYQANQPPPVTTTSTGNTPAQTGSGQQTTGEIQVRSAASSPPATLQPAISRGAEAPASPQNPSPQSSPARPAAPSSMPSTDIQAQRAAQPPSTADIARHTASPAPALRAQTTPPVSIQTAYPETKATPPPAPQTSAPGSEPKTPAVNPGQVPTSTAVPADKKIQPSLLQAVNRILEQFPRADGDLSADKIQRSLESSGLFLEARLAAGQIPQNDLKASLFRLLFLLGGKVFTAVNQQPSPAGGQNTQNQPASTDGTRPQVLLELRNQVEGALARVQLNQLASMPTEDQTRQVWQFELPINRKEQSDSFLLRFERETRGSEPPRQTYWTVTLDFDIAPLGPISARLALHGDEISSHFTAQLGETASRISSEMPKLEQALIKAGLSIRKLSATQGSVPKPELQSIPAPLLDERA
jgi:hypothetical protein